MYIYQNGKLYVQDGDFLVGVEIYPDKVRLIAGTETTLDKDAQRLTYYEVSCKWNIRGGNAYIFPVEKNAEIPREVEVNDTVGKTKTSTRKSSRK